jgi:multidrug efflux pump subunit AcrA (membrane-fusion protein)
VAGVIALAAVLAAGGYAALRPSATAAPAAAAPSPATPVTVAPVEEKLLADSDEITGHVDATETVELRARVSGHIDSVNFQAGQIVKAGDLLFSIDPRWYKAQFDLDSARAEVAAHEAKRAEQLLAVAAISIEEAEARRARAAEAQAALATSRLDLEHTQVRAPITGRIARAYVTAGFAQRRHPPHHHRHGRRRLRLRRHGRVHLPEVQPPDPLQCRRHRRPGAGRPGTGG